MEILDKNLEVLLEKLLKKYGEQVLKFTDKPLMINQADCDKSEITALCDMGYFDGTYRDSIAWYYFVTPTQKAKYYFENKEKFLANEKQNKQKENVRYWITTGLSIGALVVSIIALIVSFCK